MRRMCWKCHGRRPERAPRISQLALAAAAQAVDAARIGPKSIDRDSVGVVFCTDGGAVDKTTSNLEAISQDRPRTMEPLSFQDGVWNIPGSLVNIEYGFRGPMLALPMGWAAGGYGVAVAADLVSGGFVSAVVVVAADILTSLEHDIYRRLRLASPNDRGDEATRPFDIRHNGPVLAEGAAALVLERRDHAEGRRAPACATLAGWAITSDADGIGAKKRSSGIRTSMQESLAGGPLPEVVYSGSYCTADADRAEARAIRELFGERTPWVTNIRGVAGEARSVTGLLNVIAAARSLETGIVPPTAGFERADPLCALKVPTRPAAGRFNSILCNNFFVNGINSSCLLRRAT